MTTLSKIGPIELSRPNQITRNPQNDKNSRTMVIRCSPEEARQLKGLAEPLIKSESGLKVVSCKDSRWGIMPVESPIRIESSFINEATEVHKGLMAISKVEDSFFNQKLSEVTIEGEMISQNTNEILTILHSQGGEDGSDIEMSSEYSDLTEETILDEDFSDFDTTNIWEAKYDENMASGEDIVSSGGKLVFSGASATNWTWGYLWTILQDTVPDEFTAEFTLEWNALPTGGAAGHHINLFLVDGRPSNKTEIEYKDMIRILIDVRDTGALLSIVKRVRGVYSQLISPISLASGEKTPAIKLELSGRSGVSNLTVYVDKDYSSGTPDYGNPIFGPANTRVNFDLDRYLVLSQENASSTSATTRVAYLNMYQYVDALKPNIVPAPVGAILDRTPDFYRVSEDGNIPCIKNPTTFPTYQITPANFYKGTVKGMNSNYADSTSRLVTSNEFTIDPTKFSVSNGLVKLVPAAQAVAFQYWNGTAWATLNTFTLPNAIQLIRPFLVTKDSFILQIDRTLWELKSGSYGVWVEHSYDALGFTRTNTVYNDETITNSLGAAADVTMLSQYYSLHFNRYNLLSTNAYGIETDATAWAAVGADVPTQTTPGHAGSYAVTTTTDNSASGEGLVLSSPITLPITPSVDLGLQAIGYLKGSGTVKLYIEGLDSSSTLTESIASGTYTLGGSFASASVDFTLTDEDTVKALIKVLTPTTQEATIIGDSFALMPTPNSDATGNLFVTSPTSTYRYGMYIIKKDPTTIKSDSIPASDLTGIGVYDQMQPPTADNGFISLAREWFRPTWQKTILEGVI